MANSGHSHTTVLPPKGCVVDIDSAVEGGDAVFDVALTSNCIGAAVLVYLLLERFDTGFVSALAHQLGASEQHPFGPGIGIAYLEHAALGKAVLRYGGREIRLTLLLGASLDQRRLFESALVQSAQAAPTARPARGLLHAPIPSSSHH